MSKNKSIKNRILVISIGVIIILFAFLILIINTVGKNNLTELESRIAEININRAYAAYEYIVDNYENKIVDWGEWDDTYKFIDDLNQDYIASNLVQETMENLNIDRMVFFDLEGKLKYATSSSNLAKLDTSTSDEVEYFFANHSDVYQNLQKNKMSSGLVSMDGGTMLYTAHNILKSDGSGDSKGYILFGRYIGDWFLKDLSLILQIPVRIKSLYSQSDSLKNIFISGNKMNSTFAIPVDERGSLVLEFTTSLDLLTIVAKNARYLLLMILLLSFVAVVANYIVVKKFVVNEVYILDKELEDVSNKSDKERINAESSTSEFFELRHNINRLIDSTNLSKKQLEEKIDELNKLNKLMVGREVKMKELKEVINNIKKRLI